MADLQARARAFVDPELPAETHDAALGDIVNAVRRGELTVPQLVGSLADQLTTEDNAVRSRACQLLAEVIKGVPDVPLQDTAIHSLSEFFASRLADFPSLRGALTGALALLKRPPQVGALRSDDVFNLGKAIVTEVHVQSLTAVDRLLSYELFETLIESHPAAIQALGGDFLEGLVAAIDGEKDPRCLLLAFRLVEIVPRVHENGHFPGGGAHLKDTAEELFEVIAVYFPISFNPPPNDTRGITREDLVLGLERALSATPLFAPYSIPLFIEKLASSLTSAKLDSLHALQTCARAYGAEAISAQTGPLWAALKAELLPPSVEAASAGDVGPVQERSAAVGAAAAEALTQCVRTLAGESAVSMPLVGLVLEDPSLQDLFSAAKSERLFPLPQLVEHTGGQDTLGKNLDSSFGGAEEGARSHQGTADVNRPLEQDAESLARSKESADLWSQVISAVATAGAASCGQVTEALVAKVLASGGLGFAGLRLLSEVARAARTLAWSTQAVGLKSEHNLQEDPDAGKGELDVGDLLGGKAEVMGQIFSGVVTGVEGQKVAPGTDVKDLAALAVTGLEALASIPPPFPAKPTPLLRSCVSVLADLLLAPPSDEHTSVSLKQKALQALASISRGAPSNSVSTAGKASSDSWQGSTEVWAAVSARLLPDLYLGRNSSLEILGTLAGSSAFINREVLAVLRGLMDGLWAATRSGEGVKSEEGAVEVLRLLAKEVLPRFGPGTSEQEAVLLFVRDLLEHLAGWPQPGRPNDGLLTPALGALSVATRVCTEANQAAIFHKSAPSFFQILEGSEVWRAGPLLAILIGLRPSVSAEAGAGHFLQGLLNLALQKSDALVPDAASVALASVLNKWPTPPVRNPPVRGTASPACLRGGPRFSLEAAQEAGQETVVHPETGPSAGLSATATAEQSVTEARASSRTFDTTPSNAPYGQSGSASSVSTASPILPAQPPVAEMTSPPHTPASAQRLPRVSSPATETASEYSPAVFFTSSPQSVLLDTTPVSVLQTGNFSPAGGSLGPSPEPPAPGPSGLSSAPGAPASGVTPAGRRRVAQRLNLSSLGGPDPAASTPPREVHPSEQLPGGERIEDLESALRAVLDEKLLPLLESGNTENGHGGLQAQVQGLRVLAIVGQGLTMRGHKRTGDVVNVLVQLLFTLGKELADRKESEDGVNASSIGRATAGEGGGKRDTWRENGSPGVGASTLASFQTGGELHLESNRASAYSHQGTQRDLQGLRELANVAAESFGVITGENRFFSEGGPRLSEDLVLSKDTHAQIKPLYRQRLFTISLGPVSDAIRRARNPEERLPLYRGLAHLLKGTPPAALALEAQKVLLLLLESLSIFASSPAPSDGPLVLSHLLTLTSFLMDQGPAREQVSEHVHSVVRTLVQLAAYKASTGVREVALQALIAAADLPFTRVYPLRNEVHKAVLAALDDPKRVVRKEAVRCRRVWTALSSFKK